MIEQVYRTDDGSIFYTKEDAEHYENFTIKRDELANLIYKDTSVSMDFGEASEIATVVMNFYNVSEK